MNAQRFFCQGRMRTCAQFLLPFLCWVILFRDFIFGPIAISVDTIPYYTWMKYFLNNLREGVVPLWDPYLNSGRSYVYLSTSAVFNPLLTLFVLPVSILTGNYYAGYMTAIVIYFLIGLWGFYLVAREVLEDDTYAYYAYLFLLFSGVGTHLFNQVTMLYIFVPGVWFFYFFFRLARHFKRADFLGLIFSLIVAMNAYVPFYFVTVFLFFAVCCAVLYPRAVKNFVTGGLGFLRSQWKTVLLGLLALMIACIPVLAHKNLDGQGENVAPGRHCEMVDQKECFDRTFDGTAGMSYDEAKNGHFGWRFNFQRPFAHLDKLSYSHDGLFFIPIFCFLLIFISAYTTFNRRLLVLLALVAALFLLAIADMAGLHRFLYEHIFYFKYFRNFLMFMIYIIAIMILLAVHQLKAVFEEQNPSLRQREGVLLIVLMHALFLLVLRWHGHNIVGNYLTVIGSCLFFAGYYAGFWDHRKMGLNAAIIFLIVAQPLQVLFDYGQHAQEFACEVPSQHVKPVFRFLRPETQVTSPCKLFSIVPAYIEDWNDLLMLDSPETGLWAANVPKMVFFLSARMQRPVFTPYLRKKLMLFDNVAYLDETDLDESLKTFTAAVQGDENLAYISENDEGLIASFNAQPPESPHPVIVQEESPSFQVLHFDVNSLKIRTDYKADKFLVYNDSFNSYWKATINGRESRIYRANMAFKGIKLPAGENIVDFVYRPPGGQGIYILVLLSNALFFIYFVGAWDRQRRELCEG